jgi:hypothetical protein
MIGGIALWNSRFPTIPSTVITIRGFVMMDFTTLRKILLHGLFVPLASSLLLPTSINTNPIGFSTARDTGASRYKYMGYSGCDFP